ncbi:copper chaperone PCu(A)C [Kouleothrix sp.]|uniref:copper chaperone PCu(A)C n=1 Tax=Kouleothrix sp. TaxID=2779161 RepID=UPI00391D22FB
MRRFLIATLLVAALGLSACGTSDTASAPAAAPTSAPLPATAAPTAPASAITITNVWARPAAMGGTAGAKPTDAMAGAKPTDAMAGAKPTDAMAGGMASDMGGANGAMYLTISNSGGAPDRLLKVVGDIAKSIELHTVIKNGDVMQMRPVEAVDVPANGSVELKPGSFHVMLIGLNRDLKLGDTFEMTLQFEKAGPIKVQAVVKQPE